MPVLVKAQSRATPLLNGGGSGSSGMNNLPGMNFARGGVGGNTPTDSLGNIQSDWDDIPAKIYYKTLLSSKKRLLDTSLTYFHRNSRLLQWGRNLGNEGSAAYDMVFNPDHSIGFKSGYNQYDLYKTAIDSVKFYNTTRPYSDFGFLMGPKRQQYVKLLHTQNITPNWNFAAEAQNLVSPGFFNLQQARTLHGHFSTNYLSNNQRYQTKAVLMFHRFRQDENGGIADESQLTQDIYNNRSLVDVNFPGRNFSTTNSAVRNQHQELQFLYKHSYAAIGVVDTVYNEDSTSMEVVFTPRFTIQHTLDIKNQQNIFRDVAPTDERYLAFTRRPYEFSTTDSVYSNAKWLYIDNKIGLSGTLGKDDNTLSLEAGLGNRFDRFRNRFPNDGRRFIDGLISNYIYGKLTKEAATNKQWFYGANAQFYISGSAIGNFNINAQVGKVVKNIALLQLGFAQSLSEAPRFWQQYNTNFYERTANLDPSSITNISGSITVPKWKANVSARNLLMANYHYLDSTWNWQQQAAAFNVMQLSAQKNIKVGIFHNENEAIFQQIVGSAPVNIPALLLRHQVRLETPMFKSNLLFSFGIEGRYHTAYKGAGYQPYLNQFFFQNTYVLNNKPEIMVFLNFKVRAFRAFVVFDQLQQLVWTNNIYAPGYPTTNTAFRFGFNWVLYN